jgi:hypothetical protein
MIKIPAAMRDHRAEFLRDTAKAGRSEVLARFSLGDLAGEPRWEIAT